MCKGGDKRLQLLDLEELVSSVALILLVQMVKEGLEDLFWVGLDLSWTSF